MMSLSADYHDGKSSALAWVTVRGSGGTVSRFASRVVFEMLPNVLDLALAAVTFGNVCGARAACIMVVMLLLYAIVLVRTSADSPLADEWSRTRTAIDRTASDALLNWWTAHVFGRIDYEKGQHAGAVHVMSVLDARWCQSLWLSQNGKQVVMSAGFLVLCLLVGRDVFADPERSSGDLVMCMHLWSGVASPVQNVLG